MLGCCFWPWCDCALTGLLMLSMLLAPYRARACPRSRCYSLWSMQSPVVRYTLWKPKPVSHHAAGLHGHIKETLAWCGARGSYRGGLGTLCAWTIFLMWWKRSSRDWSHQDGILHSSLGFHRTGVSVAVNVEQVIYSSENWCFLYPLAFPGCMLQYPWGSCRILSCSWGIQRRVEMDKSS